METKLKVLSLLGMARRAGKVTWQEDSNLAAIKSGRARLLLIAQDAGEATAKRYLDKCTYYRVPYARFATRGAMGKATGLSSCTAIAVNDDGFAQKLLELLGQQAGG